MGEFFCLKMGRNLKLDNQRGYRDQHLLYEILSLIIEIFDFILALAQEYQFFVKSPTALGLRLWILWTLDS